MSVNKQANTFPIYFYAKDCLNRHTAEQHACKLRSRWSQLPQGLSSTSRFTPSSLKTTCRGLRGYPTPTYRRRNEVAWRFSLGWVMRKGEATWMSRLGWVTHKWLPTVGFVVVFCVRRYQTNSYGSTKIVR
jgi:hypothetical protein